MFKRSKLAILENHKKMMKNLEISQNRPKIYPPLPFPAWFAFGYLTLPNCTLKIISDNGNITLARDTTERNEILC